jgi:hypothetical protein
MTLRMASVRKRVGSGDGDGDGDAMMWMLDAQHLDSRRCFELFYIGRKIEWIQRGRTEMGDP